MFILQLTINYARLGWRLSHLHYKFRNVRNQYGLVVARVGVPFWHAYPILLPELYYE